jgi:hypothetical protein
MTKVPPGQPGLFAEDVPPGARPAARPGPGCRPGIGWRPARPPDPPRPHLLYQGSCYGCDWKGPERPAENPAVEDAHDHAWPGWRSLPLMPSVPCNDAAAAAWLARARRVYPVGWVDGGGPVRTLRGSPVTGRHHESGLWGGYSMGVVLAPPAAQQGGASPPPQGLISRTGHPSEGPVILDSGAPSPAPAPDAFDAAAGALALEGWWEDEAAEPPPGPAAPGTPEQGQGQLGAAPSTAPRRRDPGRLTRQHHAASWAAAGHHQGGGHRPHALPGPTPDPGTGGSCWVHAAGHGSPAPPGHFQDPLAAGASRAGDWLACHLALPGCHLP